MLQVFKRHNANSRVRSRCWRPSVVLYLLVTSFFSLLSSAQTRTGTEAEVKAAYLFNFGKFVRWVRPAGEAFPICIYGKDPFAGLLEATVSGEKIDGKPVVARRITSPQEAASCRVLFIGRADPDQVKKLMESAGQGVLTVSDTQDFLKQGGMIEFVNDQNRIRFEVNLAAADKAGLTLSSELLKVASAVHRSDSK